MITTTLKFSLGLLMLTSAFTITKSDLEAVLCLLLGIGCLILAFWDMKKDMDSFDLDDLD